MVTLDELRAAFVELDEELTLKLTGELIKPGGPSALSIVHTCQQALKVVGERYEREEYYLSGLIMAGELFQEVLELVQPPFSQPAPASGAGTVVLGTVAKDIHDIGKNLFASSLRSAGFKVIDLGVDVAPARFLAEVMDSRPEVLGLSGLIMAAFESMRDTVRLIRAHENELGYRLPIVLGGAIIDGRVCEFCEADSWSTDAVEGVRICQQLVTGNGAHIPPG